MGSRFGFGFRYGLGAGFRFGFGFGFGFMVRREHELQHVTAVEERLVQGSAQPLLQQREEPESLLAGSTQRGW